MSGWDIRSAGELEEFLRLWEAGELGEEFEVEGRRILPIRFSSDEPMDEATEVIVYFEHPDLARGDEDGEFALVYLDGTVEWVPFGEKHPFVEGVAALL